MSRSKNSPREQWSEESNARYAELQQMIAEGRSFSGGERNCAFLNTGASGKRFANVSGLSGIDLPDDGRALALSDWDGDGDVDPWISNRTGPQLRLFRNNTDGRARHLGLRLIGNGSTVNRDAIGARIEIGGKDPTTKPQIATTRAGEGFLAQSSSWKHFGLGERGEPGLVTIRWPDGSLQTFDGLQANHRYTITQGEAKAEVEPGPQRQVALAPNAPRRPVGTDRARVFLRAPIPLPKAGFEGFDGEKILLPSGDGQPFLVVFWASWCGPCLIELEELNKRYPELVAKGLRVIALAVNGVGEDQSDPRQAFALSEKFGGGLHFARATEGLLGDFQYLTDLAISVPRPIPLPSSFLVDATGHLAAIYKGPLDVDELLGDIGKLTTSGAERFEAAALAPGRAIPLREVRRKSDLSNARISLRLADTALRSRRPDDAVRYYEDVLRINPEHAESHVQLARLALGRKDTASALEFLRDALTIYPQYADAHRRLAEVLAGAGETAKAIQHYGLAIESYPGDVVSMNNLAWILATTTETELRDGERAIAVTTDAIEVVGAERADLLDTLAAAHAEAGVFDKAIATAKRAIELARAGGEDALADSITVNLKNYQAGRSLRLP